MELNSRWPGEIIQDTWRHHRYLEVREVSGELGVSADVPAGSKEKPMQWPPMCQTISEYTT